MPTFKTLREARRYARRKGVRVTRVRQGARAGWTVVRRHERKTKRGVRPVRAHQRRVEKHYCTSFTWSGQRAQPGNRLVLHCTECGRTVLRKPTERDFWYPILPNRRIPASRAGIEPALVAERFSPRPYTLAPTWRSRELQDRLLAQSVQPLRKRRKNRKR